MVDTTDGGQEVISARFLHPEQALAEFREGKITFMPPQYYILSTLASILQGRYNRPEQRDRIKTLSRGLFGCMVINPRRLHTEDEEGRTILAYEGDETRGGSKGRLHRSLIKVGKAGVSEIRLIPLLIQDGITSNFNPVQVTTEIILQRNFDIFTEIEAQAFGTLSKL